MAPALALHKNDFCFMVICIFINEYFNLRAQSYNILRACVCNNSPDTCNSTPLNDFYPRKSDTIRGYMFVMDRPAQRIEYRFSCRVADTESRVFQAGFAGFPFEFKSQNALLTGGQLLEKRNYEAFHNFFDHEGSKRYCQLAQGDHLGISRSHHSQALPGRAEQKDLFLRGRSGCHTNC